MKLDTTLNAVYLAFLIRFGASNTYAAYRVAFKGIPTDSVERMQCGVCRDAILQGPSGHLWHVNLCCADRRASFTDGWESFISDQFIEAGDILVFRHVDDVHFSVQVFEPSGCEKQSTFSFQNYTSCCSGERNLKNLSTICNMKRCEHRQNSTTASVSLLIGRQPNRNGDIEVKDLKMDQNEAALDCTMEFMNSSKIHATDTYENKASLCEKNNSTICACTEKISLPHLTRTEGINPTKSNSPAHQREFSVVLPKTAVTGKFRLTIPKVFSRCWMPREKVEATLLYGKEPKRWRVSFFTYPRYSGFFSGWKSFAVSNGLKEGDECVFKLLSEVEYIFKVLVIRNGCHEDCGDGERKINVTCKHALVSCKKMKTSVVNPNPPPQVIHEESIIPHPMVDYKFGVGIGSQSCRESRSGKIKIEVIEVD